MTAKYGTPYFSNYINSDMEPSDVRSMCCRLRLDLRELRKKSGGFFGSGESTGSVGVVTINLPRIAYLASDEADFYKRLDKLMDIAARSLKTKRTVITKLLDAGLYPYTKRYLGTFDNHFSTIGLIGMNQIERSVGREIPVVAERARSAYMGRSGDRIPRKIITVVGYFNREIIEVFGSVPVQSPGGNMYPRILTDQRDLFGGGFPCRAESGPPEKQIVRRMMKRIVLFYQRNGPVFDPASCRGRMEPLARSGIGPDNGTATAGRTVG